MGRRWRDVFAATDCAIAIVAALAVLALALLGARGLHRSAEARRESANRAVVAEVAIGVAHDLDDTVTAVSSAARDASAPVPVDVSRVVLPGGAAVRFVSSATPLVGGSPVLPSTDREGLVAALLDRATDSGETVVSAPVDLADGERTLIAAPVYRRDPAVGRPVTASARRARLVGWVVAAVDFDALLEPRLPPGMVGSVRDGPARLAEADLPEWLPAATIQVGGRDLAVRAGDPAGVTSPASAWALLVVGVVLAALSAGGVLALLAGRRDLKRLLARRAAQVDLIGDVAPLVQQSLELAEVLPAVAVQLSDHFGLVGVAMSAGGRSSSQVRLFSMGVTPDPTVQPVLRPPEELRAGATLVLAMQRGGRSVARLELVAGRDLDAADLQSLRALVELITAAVVNASLYASQQEALRNLQELDALKTVFLGTASHELRTPATAITGFASLLAENWERFGEEQRRDFVGRIDANARSLSAVVQDLLDFSLLDGGTVALTLESVDLPALVRGVVDRLTPVFTNHEIVLQTDPAPEVVGDVNGLERAVTNLLTNAVKFSPPGTTVTVNAGPTPDGGAEVSVSDQGPGIAPEDRARVFTRFYRGSGDEVVQTRGVGIGLSVVAELVARLNGEVVLDDVPGGGARFTIRLRPAHSAHIDKEIEDATTT